MKNVKEPVIRPNSRPANVCVEFINLPVMFSYHRNTDIETRSYVCS